MLLVEVSDLIWVVETGLGLPSMYHGAGLDFIASWFLALDTSSGSPLHILHFCTWHRLRILQDEMNKVLQF